MASSLHLLLLVVVIITTVSQLAVVEARVLVKNNDVDGPAAPPYLPQDGDNLGFQDDDFPLIDEDGDDNDTSHTSGTGSDESPGKAKEMMRLLGRRQKRSAGYCCRNCSPGCCCYA